MKPIKKSIYEWFLVVEGSGAFPFDMLRYDSAFPYKEGDSTMLDSGRAERRRVVLVRRGINMNPATMARWESFGWAVVASLTDGQAATDLANVAHHEYIQFP